MRLEFHSSFAVLSKEHLNCARLRACVDFFVHVDGITQTMISDLITATCKYVKASGPTCLAVVDLLAISTCQQRQGLNLNSSTGEVVHGNTTLPTAQAAQIGGSSMLEGLAQLPRSSLPQDTHAPWTSQVHIAQTALLVHEWNNTLLQGLPAQL